MHTLKQDIGELQGPVNVLEPRLLARIIPPMEFHRTRSQYDMTQSSFDGVGVEGARPPLGSNSPPTDSGGSHSPCRFRSKPGETVRWGGSWSGLPSFDEWPL